MITLISLIPADEEQQQNVVFIEDLKELSNMAQFDEVLNTAFASGSFAAKNLKNTQIHVCVEYNNITIKFTMLDDDTDN